MEDYKKKYEEALEIAKEEIKKCGDNKGRIGMIENIFPELKESEDERTKKSLLSFLHGLSECEYPNKVMYGKWLAWLEKQKTTEEALQYLKENHSPSEMSDFQAAMNIAVAKAYNKGYADGFEKQSEQKPAWSENDEMMCKNLLFLMEQENSISSWEGCYEWLKSIKERHSWKPSDEQIKALQESIGIVGELTSRGECLKELVEQLENLMEE